MVTRPVIDEFFTLSDDQLLERIRGIDDALLSPDQSGSSKDVGSYTTKSPAELERIKNRMVRCYALRTGQAPLPRPGGGVKYHRVFVRKDY